MTELGDEIRALYGGTETGKRLAVHADELEKERANFLQVVRDREVELTELEAELDRVKGERDRAFKANDALVDGWQS